MRHIVSLPSLETLHKHLSYDPLTGNLHWKKAEKYAKQREEGRVAGTLSKGGYLRVSIERRMYANHRVVWKMVTGSDPAGIIDHADGDKLNNRFENLRDATQRENLYNSVRRSDNTTGFKGVVFDKRKKAYIVNIKVDGKRLQSPLFRTPEAANDYAVQLRSQVHGEFVCHGDREAA